MIDLPAGTVVVLYGRTSGDRQKKEASIQTQFAELKAECDRLGLVIYDCYGDEAVRNIVPLEERADGARLLRDAQAGRFEAVLIYSSSRLARDSVVFHHNRKLLGKVGVAVFYLTEDLKFDTPSNRLTSTVKLAVNEYEKDAQGELMLSGRYRIAAEGLYTGGVVDYGYRLVPHGLKQQKYDLCPVEAPQMERMYDLTTVEHWPTVEVAKLLTRERVPTALERPENGHRPCGRTHYEGWSPNMIAKLLRKPVYMGVKSYGGGFRPKVQCRVPAIVTAETWHSAQEYLAGRIAQKVREDQHLYLLSGKVRCALCGRAYTGNYIRSGHSKTKVNYYYTARVHKSGQHQHRPNFPCCPGPLRIRADEVEAGTWERLLAHILDTEGTLQKIHEENRNGDQHLALLISRRDAALREKSAIEEEHLLAKRGRSRIGMDLTFAEAQTILQELEPALTRVEEQIDALSTQMVNVGQHEERLCRAEQNLRYWAPRVSGDLCPRIQRHLVELFVDQVLVSREGDTNVYTCYLIFDPQAWEPGQGRKGGTHILPRPTSRRGAGQYMLVVRFRQGDITDLRRTR